MSGEQKGVISKVLLFLAASAAGYFVCYPVTDGDIFWHLAAGREIFTKHKLLYFDPFSYTTENAQWINLHWFFQVLMYMVFRTGGYGALIAVKGLTAAAAAWLIFNTFTKTNAGVSAAFAAAFLIYTQRYLIPLRPVIFTLFLTALFISSFEKYCRSGRVSRLLPVFIGQIVWVNSQGLFILGPVIAAAYGAGELLNLQFAKRFPRLFTYRISKTGKECGIILFTIPILFILSLVNPYGWKAIGFALKLFSRIVPSQGNIYSQTIIENTPLLSMIGTFYSHYVTIFVIVAGLTLFSVILTFRTVRFSHMLLAAAGMLLAWMAQRNGIIFTFFALPGLLWIISGSSPMVRLHPLSAVGKVLLTIGPILLIVAIVNHTKILSIWPHTISPFSHPTESAEIIRNNNLSSRIFNADRYGGYLIWKLYPSLKVSHDTRLSLRSKEFYREYLAIIGNPELFNEYARQRGITYAVIPVAPVDCYLPLASALYSDPRWKMIFTDGAEVLFAADTVTRFAGIDMDSPEIIDSICAGLRTRFGDSKQVYRESLLRLRRWCMAVGAYGSARKIYLFSDNRQKEF